MYSVAILGASGYAGGELIRFVDAHPHFEASFLGANRRSGEALGTVHPQLTGGDRMLQSFDVERLRESDLVFMALPHGASGEPAMQLYGGQTKIVDLGSDFRLDTPQRYLEAYGHDHPFPEELGNWVYGIPELSADAISASTGSRHPVAIQRRRSFPSHPFSPLASLSQQALWSTRCLGCRAQDEAHRKHCSSECSMSQQRLTRCSSTGTDRKWSRHSTPTQLQGPLCCSRRTSCPCSGGFSPRPTHLQSRTRH